MEQLALKPLFSFVKRLVLIVKVIATLTTNTSLFTPGAFRPPPRYDGLTLKTARLNPIPRSYGTTINLSLFATVKVIMLVMVTVVAISTKTFIPHHP